jgi:hypothetical protein
MVPFSRLFIAVLFAGVSLLALAPTTAMAGGPKKPPPPPPDTRKMIKSVDAATNSVTIIEMDRKVAHTFRLDDTSSILIDGTKAPFSSIKVGMEVSDSTDRDDTTLDSISLLTATHAPVAPSTTSLAGPAKTIESVQPDKNDVVMFNSENKQEHTYHIDDSTTLTVNNQPGKFDDMKPGMEVKDFTERDNDDLDSLTLIGWGDEPKKPAKPTNKK